MAVKWNDLAPHEIESVLLKKFGETLTKGALMWYSLLPEHSIDSFKILADSFIKAHSRAKKVQARKADIFRIAQGESELLQEFVTRFQIEKMLLPDVPDEWAVEAFTKDRFITDRRADRSPNNRSLHDKETSGSRDPSCPKLSEYNFNVSVVELVSATRNIKEALFPKPMRFDPSQRDPNLWYEYRRTNGHQTGDCRHLREEVATLREFLSDQDKNNYGRNHDNTEPTKAGEDPPRLRINMIFGGNEINGVTFSVAITTKLSVTHSKRLWGVVEENITFTEEDMDGLFLPHNDALVISLNALHFKIKRVLVDLGSLANIIQWRVLYQAKLTGSIIPATKLLAGFNLASVTIQGEILLPTNVEGVMKTTLFEAVDSDTGYNIILGRPWLHEMKAVPSTYHQLLKFPTPEGIKQIIGNQPAAKEMYAILVSSSKGKEHAA
ncbi:uncharacterized protein [Nicotiana tomentosiformis]